MEIGHEEIFVFILTEFQTFARSCCIFRGREIKTIQILENSKIL